MLYGRTRTLLILVNFTCLVCFIGYAKLESLQSKHETSVGLSPDEKMQIIKSVVVLESRPVDWDKLRERYFDYIRETRGRRLSMKDNAVTTSSSRTSLDSHTAQHGDGLDNNDLNETIFVETRNLASTGDRKSTSIVAKESYISTIVGDRTSIVTLDRTTATVSNQNVTTRISDRNVVATLRDTNFSTGDGNQTHDDIIGVDDDVIPNIPGQKNNSLSLEPSWAPVDQVISMSPSIESTKGAAPTQIDSSVSQLPSIQVTQDSVPTGQSNSISIIPSIGGSGDPTKGGAPTQNDDSAGLDDDLPPGIEPTSAPTTHTDVVGTTASPSNPALSQRPNVANSNEPTPSPSNPALSQRPNVAGSNEPSPSPSDPALSQRPNVAGSNVPTPSPSNQASSQRPSVAGSNEPTPSPSNQASSQRPSVARSNEPTPSPSNRASSQRPSVAGSNEPTPSPSSRASSQRPSVTGKKDPTQSPSFLALPQRPTKFPSATPSLVMKTSRPTRTPAQPDQPSSLLKPKPSPSRVQTPAPTVNRPDTGGVIIPMYRYNRGNCPDQGSMGVPCAPDALADLCSKYDDRNRGSFSACLQACEPSFCCIHDAPEKTNSVAPTCHTDENCAQYAPCYIVWWKIHDTIGPAPYLHLSQSDDFFNEDTLQNVTTDPEFYGQWAYHHWHDINDLLSKILNDVEDLQSLFANPMIWEPGNQ